MCGILGYTGREDAIEIVLEGLKRLEYRGYDSAGIAFFNRGSIEIKRCKGKIKDLESLFTERNSSNTAIGHTRWATHGKPSEENAHPHRAGRIVLVHNGIIENYLELKRELTEKGHRFTSETDTEVLCHLIDSKIDNRSLEEAIIEALKPVKGAYAIAVMNELEPGKIVGVRKDCPLILGLSDKGYFLASDIPAFLQYSRDVIFLDDGDMVSINPGGYELMSLDGRSIKKTSVHIDWSPVMAEKGGYKHFMLKEIFEQPRAVADTLRGRISLESGRVNIEEFNIDPAILQSTERIMIVACGTSYHAGLAGRYMIEELAGLPVQTEIGSEFRYRKLILEKNTLVIAITQSGETADTIAAIREAKSKGLKVLTICNVLGSTASRESDGVFYTHAGPEIGVASTKAFTTQLVSLYIFSLLMAWLKGRLDLESIKKLLSELIAIPEKIEEILKYSTSIEAIAKHHVNRRGFLFLGRGINYPIALEGALKLKEISYIHAEGYPAGEMKHGPIALIDDELPVVVIATRDELYEKLLSNMQEVKSRGGIIISIVTESDREAKSLSDYVIEIPSANKYLSTILSVIPLQLLAYYVGVTKGYDVDQPRNLAKSVTVE
ncbi:MAG: glutamine--fructose-6-phosphate transaminase (isomerizing) [Thermodesulfovibrionales bacterium]|nr:glutamine--fructose-6-phosphate transaminase (isomerizing) [Thermodesulfovibrionales bacterium]